METGNREHKKKLNTRGVKGKQDTLGDDHRANQLKKLQRTTKHGAEQEIT